jgi:hypothetical protein
MRLGLLVLILGGGLDLLYHAASLDWALPLDTYLGRDGVGAHLVTFIGMIVTLLGLFAQQLRLHEAREEIIPPEGRATIEH